MPPELSNRKKLLISASIAADLAPQNIASIARVSYRHVQRLCRRIEAHGDVENLQAGRRGPKKKLTEDMEEVSGCIAMES